MRLKIDRFKGDKHSMVNWNNGLFGYHPITRVTAGASQKKRNDKMK